MNIEELRAYCLSKKGVEETFPFDDTTLVFKVLDKMFALVSLVNADTVNLKCDPDRALDLRDQYDAIIPGFHMNKKHWNSVSFQELESTFMIDLINHSYDLVVLKMTKKQRMDLANN
jgi:predicted DNA-binding protein (MmcQ/YjbR family)